MCVWEGFHQYLAPGCQDLDAAVVADIRGRVQQVLDVGHDVLQLELGGHRGLTRPKDKNM